MRQNKKIVKAVGVGLGAAAISAALLTGCDRFSPSQQELQGVYGPPIDESYDPADGAAD